MKPLGAYADRHADDLEENGIDELVDEMMDRLKADGIRCSPELGPVIPQNGELGFSVPMPGMKFCVSVRASRKAKIIVTGYSEAALSQLGISLDGPKGGRVDYWVINEFKGRYEVDVVIKVLEAYWEKLKQR